MAKANKSTQYFNLHEFLKANPIATKEDVAKKLGVAITSVPVYIHALKHKFKAKIETVKDGRFVIAYKLVNKDESNVPKFRSNAASGLVRTLRREKDIKSGTIAVPDKDLDITKIDDNTMADVRNSLGINTGFNGGRNSDY